MLNEQQSAEINRERYATYQHEAVMDRLVKEAMRNRPASTWRTSVRRIAVWVRVMLSGQAPTVLDRQENGRRLAH